MLQTEANLTIVKPLLYWPQLYISQQLVHWRSKTDSPNLNESPTNKYIQTDGRTDGQTDRQKFYRVDKPRWLHMSSSKLRTAWIRQSRRTFSPPSLCACSVIGIIKLFFSSSLTFRESTCTVSSWQVLWLSSRSPTHGTLGRSRWCCITRPVENWFRIARSSWPVSYRTMMQPQ